MKEWNNILDMASIELMKLLIQQRNKRLAILETDIVTIESKLNNLDKTEKHKDIEKKVKLRTDKIEKDTKLSKQRKFRRDKEDYVNNCYRSWKTNQKETKQDNKGSNPNDEQQGHQNVDGNRYIGPHTNKYYHKDNRYWNKNKYHQDRDRRGSSNHRGGNYSWKGYNGKQNPIQEYCPKEREREEVFEEEVKPSTSTSSFLERKQQREKPGETQKIQSQVREENKANIPQKRKIESPQKEEREEGQKPAKKQNT
ncbi:hypothetical protein FKM82_018475 [Ascaphus truei]